MAQADWAKKQLPGISLDESHFGLPRTYEANAIEYFERLELESCVQECSVGSTMNILVIGLFELMAFLLMCDWLFPPQPKPHGEHSRQFFHIFAQQP